MFVLSDFFAVLLENLFKKIETGYIYFLTPTVYYKQYIILKRHKI